MSYCTKEEVNNLFGDISDDITDDMFNTVITNADSWIDSNLKKAYVPIPVITVEDIVDDLTDTQDDVDVGVSQSTSHVEYNLINVPNGLRTAAIYYAASDIILSLYHGEELPIQYDVWFNKAQQMLEDYIEAYKNSDDDGLDDSGRYHTVRHSKGLTYSQKRNRIGGVRGWVR